MRSADVSVFLLFSEEQVSRIVFGKGPYLSDYLLTVCLCIRITPMQICSYCTLYITVLYSKVLLLPVMNSVLKYSPIVCNNNYSYKQIVRMTNSRSKVHLFVILQCCLVWIRFALSC